MDIITKEYLEKLNHDIALWIGFRDYAPPFVEGFGKTAPVAICKAIESLMEVMVEKYRQ